MSDQYTPTTDEVRDVWHNSTFDALDGTEFDRWLASVKAEAWDEGAEAEWDRGDAYALNPYREGQTDE